MVPWEPVSGNEDTREHKSLDNGALSNCRASLAGWLRSLEEEEEKAAAKTTAAAAREDP